MGAAPNAVARPGPRSIALAPVFVALALGGCVTETIGPSRPRGGSASGSSASGGAPLASPVLDASFSSRVQFAIEPLGVVPFDGQVLPRISPDGRFLATQIGRAPTWETLLAQPGAQISETSITIYSLAGEAIERVSDPGEETLGLLLGRSTTNEGVLVESPRPDGSRWIGVLPWLSAEPRWLVQNADVNAHAIARAGGGIVFVRREVDDRRASLIVRTSEGVESAWYDDAIEPLFPLPCEDKEIAAFLARTGAGLEVVSVRVRSNEDRPSFGTILARARLAPEATDLAAYQSAITAQSHASETLGGVRIALFHPAAGRVAIFDPSTARIRALGEGSIGATPAPSGFLVATAEDLRYVPEAAIDAPAARRARMSARVWDRPAIAHATLHGGPFVVLSPSPTAGEIQVFRLRFDVPG